ncbi:unnamed protein product [Pleuronectes platessa]|uniref:Uncharacterized protein n=1 Tax=Pleuronectes platessa TaxID=8262 RepID=A0A9N7V3H5_PLEPL|nr:unnamed protein product [Pleuronectes platessa]
METQCRGSVSGTFQTELMLDLKTEPRKRHEKYDQSELEGMRDEGREDEEGMKAKTALSLMSPIKAGLQGRGRNEKPVLGCETHLLRGLEDRLVRDTLTSVPIVFQSQRKYSMLTQQGGATQ